MGIFRLYITRQQHFSYFKVIVACQQIDMCKHLGDPAGGQRKLINRLPLAWSTSSLTLGDDTGGSDCSRAGAAQRSHARDIASAASLAAGEVVTTVPLTATDTCERMTPRELS